MLNKFLKSTLIFLFILLSNLTYAQSETVHYIDRQAKTFLEDTYVLGYTKANRTFYILTKSGYWELKIEGNQNWIKLDYKQNDLVNESDFKNLTWVSNNNAVYLVAEGSGYIYEFTGDAIIKLENSSDQRYNRASTYFMYRNSIFNFSGYGYWQFPSFISQYNAETKLLASYITKNGVLVPPSKINALSIFNTKENSLYVWGGSKLGYSDLIPSLINNTNELWHLDIATGLWIQLGKVKMPDVFKKPVDNAPFITFNSDSKLFCLFEKQLFEFDILNDKISTFGINEEFNYSIDSKIKPAYSESTDLILLSIIPFPNQNIRRVQFVSLVNYKSTLLSQTNLYRTSFNSILKYIILAFILIGIAFIIYYYYNNYYLFRNKLIFKLSSKTIKFNNKTISILDDEELELLFWFAQNKDFVSTNLILDRLTSGSQNYESIKKRKLSTMNSIEFKLEALSQVKKSVFIERKSTEDLRLKEFKLNTEWIVIRD